MRSSPEPEVKKTGKGTFRKLWAVLYLLCFAFFVAVLLFLDLLPVNILLIAFLSLLFISLLIVIGLAKKRVKKGFRVLAFLFSFLLIGVYGVISVYALHTLDFLSTISDKSNVNYSDADVTKPFNVYISGIDSWETIDDLGRSDVNMVVTVNPETHRILLTSIPRDYKINLVGTEYTDKLTHTGMMGIDTSIASVEDLLGIHIDFYVKLNFNTVGELVDAIGGIDVESDYDFTSEYGGDEIEYSFHKGINHLDGKRALAFARERKSFLTGDHQRVKNQQIVFSAILSKMMSSSTMLVSYNKILSGVEDYIEINMPPASMKHLVRDQMLHLYEWQIDSYSLTGPDGIEDTYSEGEGYIMLHDEDSIAQAHKYIELVMNGDTTTEIEDLNGDPVEEE